MTLPLAGTRVLDSFRPDVKPKLGIDYQAVKMRNPAAVCGSISGFGQTRSYANKGGFDIVAQGASGIMRMTGEPGGRPAKVGIAMNDIAAAATSLNALLGAYIHRLESGAGQYVKTFLVEELDHPVLGRMKAMGHPVKSSGDLTSIRRPAPLLGQHTRRVLLELRVAADDITALASAGVIHERAAS